MKALLLAAGRGERLRPITDKIPKPLLPINDSTLIEEHLYRLARAGITDVVINVHYLGEMIRNTLGNGRHYGLNIEYSVEAQALETGGGFKRALKLLGDEPAAVISADTFNDYNYAELRQPLPTDCLGMLVMVDNPRHHPEGDFSLDPKGVLNVDDVRLTWSSLAVLSPDLVRDEPDERFPLRRVFDRAINDNRLRGTHHRGYWCDVGTQDRYLELQKHLSTLPVQQ